MEIEGVNIRSVSSPDAVEDITKNFIKTNAKDETILKKVICRYGPGCTHILDPIHREKFWHPRLQKLNDEQIKSHFICNECGYATNSLPDLQLHLKRKTAWSNASLIGCRINCLVDFKEWHEGFVTQYHKSGKHFVEFRMVNEKRWLVMKKVAFYIVERPSNQNNDGSEFKDSTDNDGLAPVEESSWVFCEDISVDYAFAQSVLYKIYGNSLQETGHLTRGHVCLTESDRNAALQSKSSLLYGELLPRGANKALGIKRLEAMRAESLFDLGMGTGKILIQAFLQFRNLRYIHGVELSSGRYKIAEEAAIRMVQLLGVENYQVQINPGQFISITEAVRNPAFTEGSGENSEEGEYVERVLYLQCGNMFDITNIDNADVVMMETDIPQELFPQLNRLLSLMKDGARILTYIDLRRVWEMNQLPFRQLEVNRHLSDRYPTSWSVQRGHHFYIWTRVVNGYDNNGANNNGGNATSSSGWGFLSSHGNSNNSTENLQVYNQNPSNQQGGMSSTSSSPVKGTTPAQNSRHSNASNMQGKSRESSATGDDTHSSRCLPSFSGSRSLAMRYFFGGGGSDSKGDHRDRHHSAANSKHDINNNNKKVGKHPTALQAIPAPIPSASQSSAGDSTERASPRRTKSASNQDQLQNNGQDSPTGPNAVQQNDRVVIPVNTDGSRATSAVLLNTSVTPTTPSRANTSNAGSVTQTPRADQPPSSSSSPDRSSLVTSAMNGSTSPQPVRSASGVLNIAEWPAASEENGGKPAADVSNDIRARIRSSPIPPDGVGSRGSSQNSSNKSLPVGNNNLKSVVDGNEIVDKNEGTGPAKVQLITPYEAKTMGHSYHHHRRRSGEHGSSSRRSGRISPPTNMPENAPPEMAHNIAAVSKGVPSAAANAQRLRQQEALNQIDEQIGSELSLSIPDSGAHRSGGETSNCVLC